MRFLDLPSELQLLILEESIRVRGPGRALRLRLISKEFDKETMKVVMSSRLLDPILERFGWTLPMGEAYLVHRILTEPDDGNAIILRIRKIAERLCEERHGEFEMGPLIKKLSSHLVNKRTPDDFGYAWLVNYKPWDIEIDLYLAAVVTQTQPIIDRWLASGKTGWISSPLFGQGLCVAAEYGDHAVLAAMMTREPTSRYINLTYARSLLLSEVIQFRREDATRFLFSLTTDKDAWYGNNRGGIQRSKPSTIDIFKFMREKAKETGRESDFGPKRLDDLLEHCARAGWPEMVDYLLEMGARPPHVCSMLHYPCIHGQKEVVRLLLAKCDRCTCPDSFMPLSRAISAGQIAIVRMLLEHGFEDRDSIILAAEKGYCNILELLLNDREYTSDRLQGLLVCAVRREHERMFRLLLSRGVDPKVPKTSKECVKAAKERGFESMLDLLAEAGVDVESAT